MKSRLFAIGLCVLLSALPMLAQSRGAKADPLSGTWEGELTAGERNRSIILVLKFDGKSQGDGHVHGHA